jgi:ubiquinol-cytochrome c reductase cytochrome c subunit
MWAAAFSAILVLHAAASAQPQNAARGGVLYQLHCATCHGMQLQGSPNAPPLIGAGAASVDFWVGTGRMPAAVPWKEYEHQLSPFSPDDITAIVAYVSSVSSGGAAIPHVDNTGDRDRGRNLYRLNCQQCHGAGADGALVGFSDWAPDLYHASVTQVAEAVRIGPYQMPGFDPRQLPQNDLNAIVAYVEFLRKEHARAPFPLQGSGPVPEGLVGWLAVALATLIGVLIAGVPRRQ